KKVANGQSPLLDGKPLGQAGGGPLNIIEASFEGFVDGSNQFFGRVEVSGLVVGIGAKGFLHPAADHLGGIAIHDAENHSVSAHTRSPSNSLLPCPSIKGEISAPVASMPISFHQRVKRVVPQPYSSSVSTRSSFLISLASTFFCQISARL